MASRGVKPKPSVLGNEHEDRRARVERGNLGVGRVSPYLYPITDAKGLCERLGVFCRVRPVFADDHQTGVGDAAVPRARTLE